MTTKPSLDSLAPYPKTPAEATAEALARYTSVRTQLHFIRSMELPPGHANEIHAYNALSWNFAIAYLLRALIEHAPDQADEIASGLWSEWQGGDGFGEWSFEWLTEYGIDTGKVNEITKGLAEMQAGPEMVSVRKDDLIACLNEDGKQEPRAQADARRQLLKAAGIES